MCLGNVSKDFSASNMAKTRFNGHIYDFSVGYDDVLDSLKHLMKKNPDSIIKCLGL